MTENDVLAKETKKKQSTLIADLLKSFFMPMLVGKTLVLYFGLNYSMYPGEGYGYGLIAAILLTLYGLFKFLWKYKDKEEL